MEPIIKSMLDLDRYKLTMSFAAWKLHRDVEVTYLFTNRTKKIPLIKYIDFDEIQYQINNLKKLKFTFNELEYIKGWNIFEDKYIDYLIAEVGTYNAVNFKISNNINNKDIEINFTGKWPIAILYETFILSIINEMFSTKIMSGMTDICKNAMYEAANNRLDKKLQKVCDNNIKFVEFGTRRRMSQQWQEHVLSECIKQCGGEKKLLLGTSNCYLAKKFGIEAKGTIAHEWFMVNAALDYARISNKYPINNINGEKIYSQSFEYAFECTQHRAINQWLNVYGEPMSLILTDTFGTANFFKMFDKPLATQCIGVRHDSGNPFVFARNMIEHYKKLGIDPKTKTIMFSDGLDIDLITKLNVEFAEQVNVVYGWGTNLTNDGYIQPLSIVVKAVKANDIYTVKLSDNTAKAMGLDDNMIDLYKKIFVPETTFTETTY